MLLDFLFLPALFFIGTITTWQDLKRREIKNKWIIFGLVWGLSCYFLLLVVNLNTGKESLTLTLSYLGEGLINSVIALIAGYLLWRFNFWAAGDAKLFFVFSLLLPLKYYQHSYLPYFPSFTLLINMFFLVFIFLTIHSFLFTIKFLSKKLLISPKKSLENFLLLLKNKVKKEGRTILGGSLGMILTFSFLLIVQQKIREVMPMDPIVLGLLLICLILIFSKQIFGFLQKKNVIKAITAILILWSSYGLLFELEKTSRMLLELFKTLLIFIVLFGLIKKIVDFYIEQSKEKKMSFAFWLMAGAVITIFLKTPLSFFIVSFF